MADYGNYKPKANDKKAETDKARGYYMNGAFSQETRERIGLSIIDNKEKSEFLKSMRISKPIDENDHLDIRKDDWRNKYFIFKYNGDLKSIGEASQKQLADYLKKYSKK